MTNEQSQILLYDTTLRDGTQGEVRHWSTVGASANIIEASWIALADVVEYGLIDADNSRRLSRKC